MPIKIVVDSCCEIPAIWRDMVKRVPLSIDLDNKIYIDDENLNINHYLISMRSMKTFKTSCPSTKEYLDAFDGDEDVIAITISEKLSGSYQSACIARDIYYEEKGRHKTIHIVNSKSASAGQTAILVKLLELCEGNMSTEEIINEIENFRDSHKIMFMLQSLNNLGKAGRVSPLIAKAASVLGIRCIMQRTDEGSIELRQKVIGEKRCLKELAKQISTAASDIAQKTLCISHCEGKERVETLLQDLAEFMDIQKFKNILISHTSGLSSLYADFGGIIIAF